MVCDKACLRVVLTSSFLSCDKSPSSLVDETPQKGFMTSEFFLEDLFLGRQGS